MTLDELRDAAANGSVDAQCALAWLYQVGEGVSQDSAAAIDWYIKAAEQGDPKAQCNLGFIYQVGEGVPKDDIQASVWFRMAAEQNCALAQYNLGSMYLCGHGVAQNYSEGHFWHFEAAKQGEVDAQFSLGYLYNYGVGVMENLVEACDWYRKAAEQGHAAAQHNLGLMYQNGNGVLQDDVMACHWFLEAARQGCAEAQHSLALMYDDGCGVDQDLISASIWYRKAAEQGNKYAQLNLGVLYEEGQGIPQDIEMALFWYKQAALQNQVYAIEYLERLLMIDIAALTVGKQIGCGDFGRVYEGEYHNKPVAIKPLSHLTVLTELQEIEFLREIVLMASLTHPNILSVCGYTEQPLQLVMELCHQGSLDVFLQSDIAAKLSWDIRHRMALQLANGLAYLHKHQVSPHSITSMNVLVDQAMNVKWTGFGLAELRNQAQAKNNERTQIACEDDRQNPLRWMAPEQVNKTVGYSKESDIYSLAVVMWELATLEIPYFAIESLSQISAAITCGETNGIPVDTPPRFSTAIRHCWFADSTRRPTAQQLADYLANETEDVALLQTHYV